jgi:ComF family protein
MRGAASRLIRLGLDLLYPPRCVLCGRGGDFLCAACVEALPRADGERCERCWLPLNSVPYCVTCLEHPIVLTGLRSVFRYEARGQVGRLIHAYKFGGQSCLADPLAAQLIESMPVWGIDADVIVPVPLTARRRRERGFNQALLIAEGVSRAFEIPVDQALVRVRSGVAQAHSPTAEQRRRNVLGAFALRPGADISGRRALLIDDVATTGATLDACACALIEGGAAAVYGLTIARED